MCTLLCLYQLIYVLLLLISDFSYIDVNHYSIPFLKHFFSESWSCPPYIQILLLYWMVIIMIFLFTSSFALTLIDIIIIHAWLFLLCPHQSILLIHLLTCVFCIHTYIYIFIYTSGPYVHGCLCSHIDGILTIGLSFFFSLSLPLPFFLLHLNNNNHENDG